MNVASLELCQELYKMSKWEPQDCAVYALLGESTIFQLVRNPEPNLISMDYYIPAYDLSFLLRKLPRSVKGDTYRLGLVDNVNSYRAGYYNERFWEAYEQYGDTPED